MKNEIVKLNEAPELQGIEKSKAEQIKKTFEPMVEMLQEFEDAYKSVMVASEKEITKETTNAAKRLRLDISKVRIETGKLKDKQKEQIKLEDRAIMGVHNILVWAVKEKEDKLKEIETHFETQEKLRLEKLQSDRAEKLSKYVEDAHERNLSGMDEDVWKAYLGAKKKEHEDRIEAERKAEEERIAKAKAEKEEQERIRKENEKLRKEREEAEKREAELREHNKKRNEELKPYIIFIRDYDALVTADEKEYQKQFADIKKGAEQHWDHEREEKRKQELKEKAQREENERLQKELREKREAEEKARKEAEELAKSQKPKKDLLKIFENHTVMGSIPESAFNDLAKAILEYFRKG